MDYISMQNIVSICLSMDQAAASLYKDMSETTKDNDLKVFWNNMSQEELKHVECWTGIVELANSNAIPQIFDDPETVYRELSESYKKIFNLSSQSSIVLNRTESFFLAFRLEFYLIHPAFEQLWQFYRIVRNSEYNPGREYDNHIHEFIEAMHKFGASSVELEVLGEAVERIWENSKRMADDVNLDHLTSILNRRGFNSIVMSLAHLSKRNSISSSVLIIDIDYFKDVNDQCGHVVGDGVLKNVARIISTNIRASDILGRYGGEEFIIFLPASDNQGIYAIAEKIRKAVQHETESCIPVTISIGGACSNFVEDAGWEIQELILKADKNLYLAKQKGRNQTVC